MRDEQETLFRWPADGAPFLAVQDAMASMGHERVVAELLPLLHGRSAVAVWLVLEGADADRVQAALRITASQLRGMAATVIDALAECGETVILPQPGAGEP